MKQLSLSWTTLSLWATNQKEQALSRIAGMETVTTAAMVDGRDIHAEVAKNKLKLIPELSDAAIYENNEVGEKETWVNYFEVQILPHIKLKLVIDVLDPQEGIIVDWKTGKRNSYENNKMQIYIYALAVKKLGIADINRGIFAHIYKNYDYDTIHCIDYSIFKINQEKLDLAENYIETIGNEIYTYLKLDK